MTINPVDFRAILAQVPGGPGWCGMHPSALIFRFARCRLIGDSGKLSSGAVSSSGFGVRSDPAPLRGTERVDSSRSTSVVGPENYGFLPSQMSMRTSRLPDPNPTKQANNGPLRFAVNFLFAAHNKVVSLFQVRLLLPSGDRS